MLFQYFTISFRIIRTINVVPKLHFFFVLLEPIPYENIAQVLILYSSVLASGCVKSQSKRGYDRDDEDSEAGSIDILHGEPSTCVPVL